MLKELWNHLQQGAQLQITPSNDKTVDSITYTPHKSLNKVVISARVKPGCETLKHAFTDKLYGTDEHLYNQTLPLDYQSFHQSIHPILKNKTGEVVVSNSHDIGRGDSLTIPFDREEIEDDGVEEFRLYDNDGNTIEEHREVWVSVILVILFTIAALLVAYILGIF